MPYIDHFPACTNKSPISDAFPATAARRKFEENNKLLENHDKSIDVAVLSEYLHYPATDFFPRTRRNNLPGVSERNKSATRISRSEILVYADSLLPWKGNRNLMRFNQKRNTAFTCFHFAFSVFSNKNLDLNFPASPAAAALQGQRPARRLSLQ